MPTATKARLSKTKQAKLRRQMLRNYTEGEKTLRPFVVEAINAYLAVCRRRLDQAAWPALGDNLSLTAAAPFAAAMPEPNAFTVGSAQDLSHILAGAGEEWPGILDSKMMGGYAGYLGAIPIDAAIATNPAVVSEIGAWREEWLAERRQELVGVPDAVSSQLRTELTDLAKRNGTSVEDARLAAQKMLDKGYPSWAGRANLIARTEVVSANNQANLRAWTAMADASGMNATKSWVGGTRPTHSAVSGDTIDIGAKFQVGASEMNGPGDGAGGPGEVCNCRCGLSFELLDTASGPGLSSVDEEGDAAAEADVGGGSADSGGDMGGGDSGAMTADEQANAAMDGDWSSMSDDQLSVLLGQAAGIGDEAGMDRVMAELERRDQADAELKQRETANRPTDKTAMAQDAAKEAEYERLLATGMDPEQAFSDVYGSITDADRKKQIIQELRSQGYSGKGWEHMTQDVFQQEASRMYWKAEHDIKGYFLNDAGRGAHINPESLFTGPESRARKYASDELRQFWADHGRLTIDDVRANLLGGKTRSASSGYWA